jgi:hypothetical protein
MTTEVVRSAALSVVLQAPLAFFKRLLRRRLMFAGKREKQNQVATKESHPADQQRNAKPLIENPKNKGTKAT